ncbi:MAG: class I tRNA ligase family protein, partial [Candidatus Taylorbacteria bacterium]|nr:class I tRNA ligase family protein [Candidatus Taylorbacteria bacterium]
IKDLAHRGLLFSKEKYTHNYPHCWRCHTALIYYARDSWYIAMSKVRDQLVSENKDINWEPSYIKDGRFGEWLKDIKDWAISRERYWGTPLPLWECSACHTREVVGSFEALFLRGKEKKLTRLILLRHGESEKNVRYLLDSSLDGYPLTKEGVEKAKKAGEKLKGTSISALYASPVRRTRETAEIVSKAIGVTPTFSDELWEVRSGEWEGKTEDELVNVPERGAYNTLPHEAFYKTTRGASGESWQEVEDRMRTFAQSVLKKHQGETVVIISHEGPLMTLMRHFKQLTLDEMINLREESRAFHQGLLGGYAFPTPVYVNNETGLEIDPHRPFIDEFKLSCSCGGEMVRAKEVVDVWFDSGAMPFAQEHYPFKNVERINEGKGYPADFISEAIDQTRGWFYTLHAIGVLMGKGKAYKNVICLGHILDGEGKKMSKSVGNVVDPNVMIEKYGADALRFWMYSVNQPGEPKNFDEKTVDEVVKKVFNLAGNVLAFYKLYATSEQKYTESKNALDVWIVALLNRLIANVTASLDVYQLLEATRAIKDFIADLSQWYLRRSRDRIKNGGAPAVEALTTLRYVLIELSKIMAPFTPFFAEYLYQNVEYGMWNMEQEKEGKEDERKSVHLEVWPTPTMALNPAILENMRSVRDVVEIGHSVRSEMKINVRQPLSCLEFSAPPVEGIDKFSSIIENELNIKKIVFVHDLAKVKNRINDGWYVKESNRIVIAVNKEITSGLKEEGNVREFVRAIQEVRKNAGLTLGDLATLIVETDEKGKKFVQKYEKELMKVAQLKGVNFAPVSGDVKVAFDDFSLKVSIQM